jgi:hypothetical protein
VALNCVILNLDVVNKLCHKTTAARIFEWCRMCTSLSHLKISQTYIPDINSDLAPPTTAAPTTRHRTHAIIILWVFRTKLASIQKKKSYIP